MKRNSTFYKDQIAWSGDTCFLFKKQGSLTKNKLRTLKAFINKNPDWFFKQTGETAPTDTFSLYLHIRDFYRRLKHKEIYQHVRQNYAWLSELPVSISYQIQEDREMLDSDAFAILPTIPYCGFGYIIQEDGMAQEFYDMLKMHRLFGVHQLGFMHDPVHRVHNTATMAMDFTHTRGLHQLDVYAVMMLIIENNPCLEPHRTVLLAAAISHDGRSPAGGDTTKLIDLELFDEEKNYKDFFKFSGWQVLKKKYHLNEDELYSVVQGKGLLGSVLDIADKIAYTARDVFMFMGMDADQSKGRSVLYMEGKRLIKENPYICNIWKHVRIVDNKVVITHSNRLANFLKLRAIMFKELYYKRESRFLEYVLSKKIIKYLFEKHYITFDQLLTEHDGWLEFEIHSALGINLFPSSFVYSKIKFFTTHKSAKRCYKYYKKATSLYLYLIRLKKLQPML